MRQEQQDKVRERVIQKRREKMQIYEYFLNKTTEKRKKRVKLYSEIKGTDKEQVFAQMCEDGIVTKTN